MPSFVTHYYFGQEVKKNIALDKAIDEYPLTFNMGLQGPDLYFYYFDSSDTADGSIRPAKLGTFLHNHAIYEQFDAILELLKKNRNNGRYIAYAYGLLCHYAMDSVAHPYIYYMQEEWLPQFYPENKQGALHMYFETRLDNYVFHEKLNKSIKRFSNAVITKSEDREAIASFNIDALDPLLGVHIDSNKIIKATKMFRTYQNVFDDPTKILPTLLKGISALSGYPAKLYGFIHPNKLDSETEDWYNKNHRYWPIVRKEDTVVNWDFEEILDRCIVRAEDIISDFDNALNNDGKLDKSLYTITYDGNRIYDETLDEAIENAEKKGIYY